LFTSPHHDAKTLARFYEDHFPKYAPFKSLTADGRVISGDALVRSRFIVEATGAPHGWRVLEIGSGSGDFLVSMCQAGAREGIGLDPALDAPEIRRASVTLRRQVVMNPDDLGHEKVNLVAMFHVFEHLVDPVTFLMKLRHQLDSPGFVAIEVPNLYRYRFPNPDRYFRHIHLANFTPRSLRLAAARCGLYPLRWNRVGGKHIQLVLGAARGRSHRRDREGPSYRRCKAYLRFIRWFTRVEATLGVNSRKAAAARLGARACARLLLGSVVP
jgi:SAM-dependent methyltransferase